MKAVVLAAGRAARLRPHTDDTPKTLLPVAGVPILRRTIASLVRLGFDQLVIATGYLEDHVREAVAHWFPGLDVAFVRNPDFATTNNAATLALLAPQLAGDAFLLLDDDVVFDPGVVQDLIDRGPDCLAVRSVGGLGLEEVKIAANREDRIVAIGKHVPARGAMGESIGIALFSASSSRRLFAALADRVGRQGLVHEYYEAAIQQIIDEGATLYGVDIGTKYATEIDTIEDLSAADDHLAPRVRLAV